MRMMTSIFGDTVEGVKFWNGEIFYTSKIQTNNNNNIIIMDMLSINITESKWWILWIVFSKYNVKLLNYKIKFHKFCKQPFWRISYIKLSIDHIIIPTYLFPM